MNATTENKTYPHPLVHDAFGRITQGEIHVGQPHNVPSRLTSMREISHIYNVNRYLTGKGGTYSKGNACNRLRTASGARIQSCYLFAS